MDSDLNLQPISLVRLLDDETLKVDLSKIDLKKTKKWYFHAVNAHKTSVNDRIKFCKGLLIYKVSTILLIFALVGIAAQNSKTTIYYFICAVLTLLFSFSVWAFYYKSKKKKVVYSLQNGHFKEINSNQLPFIWSICKNLIEAMRLDSYSLRIIYIKSDFFEAYTVLEDEYIYLFLSRGFITHAEQNMKNIESILGHEFGHVLLGDNKSFLSKKKFMFIPVIFIIMQYLLVMLFYTQMPSMESISVDLFIILTLHSILKERKNSEYLADIASIIFVENSNIKNIINSMVPDVVTFDYPSSSMRIQFIDSVLSRLE